MSKKPFFIESGLILLSIPLGILLIVAIVGGLFLGAKDTPSPRHLSGASVERPA